MARKLIVLALIFMAVIGLASANGSTTSPAASPSPSASSPASNDELSSPPAPSFFVAEPPLADTPMAEDEPEPADDGEEISGAASVTVSVAATSAAIAGFFL